MRRSTRIFSISGTVPNNDNSKRVKDMNKSISRNIVRFARKYFVDGDLSGCIEHLRLFKETERIAAKFSCELNLIMEYSAEKERLQHLLEFSERLHAYLYNEEDQ